MTGLNGAALPHLSDRVAVPAYDRSSVTVGIVHFGVGGFHRSHQAMYVDRLMNAGAGLDWGICGVGVLPRDREMADVLGAQDGLYTLVVKHPDGKMEPRVIGSLVDFVYAPDDAARVLEVMSSPQTRVVSLTITEGGYGFNQVTHEFESEDPAIAADLAPEAVPATVFGFVTEALERRRRNGTAPFTIMSCDNIQSNGDMARRVFTAFASLKDAELGEWVAREVCFPNSMVDRITPATTEHDRAELSSQFGVEDAWPVVCEPFTQWVLEDSFSDGRPRLEDVEVQMVSSVEPYELMKLRLLNASHQALGYLGYLAGYEYVHEAAQDEDFAAMLRAYMNAEAEPTLLPVPGVDLDGYKEQLIERFSNPEVRDTLQRLCAESSDRIPKWVLPVLRENIDAGRPITHGTAIVAGWARYAEGTDETGRPIQVVDRLSDELTHLAQQYSHDPFALLSLRQLFGDLADSDVFRAEFLALSRRLHEVGAARFVAELDGGQPDLATSSG